LIQEVANSLSNNLKQRVSSPLLGAYTLAAVMINWRGIVVLFTSKNNGLTLVDEILSVSPLLVEAIVYPLVFAFLFLIIFPSLKTILTWFESRLEIHELNMKNHVNLMYREGNIDPLDNLIESLEDKGYYDKVSYHDIKRLMDSLPKQSDLVISPEVKRRLK
jgi:hypothetical protein